MPKPIPFFQQYYSDKTLDKIKADIGSCLKNSTLMLGPKTDALESRFADRIGVKYAVSVNSCTTALMISLSFFNTKNKQVLVPSASFITSVSSIEFSGGYPVFIDTKPDSLYFDINDLKKKITHDTQGVVWVHLLGRINEAYEQIKQLCKKHNLFLIEDAAHALGAQINGRSAGSLGDAGCFSFYPTKILSCGTGGMITTDNEELVAYAKQKRLFGWNNKKGCVDAYGNDWFLDEIRSSILHNHMDDLEYILAERKKQADYYTAGLKTCSHIKFFTSGIAIKSSHYQYAVLLNPDIDRDDLIKKFKSKYAIDVKGIYRPCHEEPVFSHLENHGLVNTENVLNQSLCLPLFCGLTQKDQDRVITSLLKEIKNR